MFPANAPVPTKKSVLIETVEFAGPRCIGWQSHVYAFGLQAFHLFILLPNLGSAASGYPCLALSDTAPTAILQSGSRPFALRF